MNKWTKLVKSLCKKHPGKPLGAILPMAKTIYNAEKKQNGGKTKRNQNKNNNKSRKNSKSRKNRDDDDDEMN
jgi:hypothetical protein